MPWETWPDVGWAFVVLAFVILAGGAVVMGRR